MFSVPVAAQSNDEAPTFFCEPGFYQVISGQLARLEPGNETYVAIGADGTNYNAVGYRIADGHLYGIRRSELIKIDAAGTITVVANLPSSINSSYTGDFGDDGRLHISRGGQNWFAIDVDTAEITPMPGLSGDYGVADITNVYGIFYGVSSAGNLLRFDPNTQSVINLGAVSGLPGSGVSYGAAWSSAGGNLYVGRNSGQIYQVTGYSGETPVATQVASAPSTNSNDGASCSLAAAPPGIVDVDGPEPETPPSTPEGQAAAEAHMEESETVYTFPSEGLPDGPSCTTGADVDRPPRLAIDAAAVDAPTVIYSSGNSPALDDFDVLSGLWSAGSGALEQTHNCGYDYTALLRSQPLEHYVWEATVRGTGDVNHGGVIVNQSSPSTRSGAVLVDLADGGSTLRWGTYDELGYYEMIGSTVIAVSPNGEVQFRVEVRGGNVSIDVDGTTQAEFATANAGGLVGLVTSRAAAAYTDMVLTALPEVVES